MPRRLVLGCSSGSHALVERLAGAGDVLVLTDDEDELEWLATRELPVERVDPTDAGAVAAAADGVDDVDSVVVAVDDPVRLDRVVAAAREAVPDASLVAEGPTASSSLGTADRTVDPSVVLAARVLGHVASQSGERALELRSTLRSLEEPVAVVTHDNPDPDAIASAVALADLADAVGVEAVPCYFGAIAHQENRALVNLLDLELRQLEEPADLEGFGGLALVDHARPGVNDSLPPETPVDVVIDHHPTDGPDEVGFIDLRSGVGATSTLLVEYYDRLGLPIPEVVATALLYGLRVDTADFTREAVRADFEAAATLVGRADHGVLERVESPTVSPETLSVLARAIERRRRHDGVLTACVGEVTDRDALAQAADRLLDLDGVTTTVVFGIIEETVYVSARARGAAIDLGETLRAAYDRLGSAGGHAEMAGAQIPTGMLVEPEDDDPVAIVEEVLTRAFLEAVQTTYAPGVGQYAGAGEELSFLSDVVPGAGGARRSVARGGSVVGGEVAAARGTGAGSTVDVGDEVDRPDRPSDDSDGDADSATRSDGGGDGDSASAGESGE